MGRTSPPKGEYIPLSDIYNATDNGIDIFRKYTNLKKKGQSYYGLCPVHSEHSASFVVRENGNGTCYSCGWKGDAIDLVAHREGVTIQEAIALARKDFNITESVQVVPKAPVVYEYPKIDFEDMPFEKVHYKYYNAYYLTEEFLKGKVYAVRKWAMNGKVMRFDKDQYSFAYHDEVNDITKILSLNCNPKYKWFTNAGPSYIWYLPEEPVENLFYAKSNKDALVLQMLGHESTAAISENSQVSIQVLPKVYEKSINTPILHFGSNPIDAKKTETILEVYPDLRTLTTPANLLKFDCEDISDYIKHFGIQSTEKLVNKIIK